MNKQDALANCINEILSGRSTIEDCLKRYPEFRKELKPLLELASVIPPQEVGPTPEFKTQTRNRLLDIMKPQPQEGKKTGIHPWFILLPMRAVALTLLTLLVLATAAGGSVYASHNSLPGDALYPIKTSVEKLQLAVTFGNESKAYLHLDLAQRRIDEVAIQLSLKRSLDVSGLATVPVQADAAIRRIEKTAPDNTKVFLGKLAETTLDQQIILKQLLVEAPESAQQSLEKALDATRRANLIARAAHQNPGFLLSAPSVLDDSLEEGQFKVHGTVLGIEGRNWNIGGITLSNVNYPKEAPPVGSHVEIEGLVKNGQTFIIELEHEEKAGNEVKIEGTFKGTDATGKTWYVGQIPIAAPGDETPPSEGDKIEVKSEVQDGIPTVTEIEEEEDREVKLEGKLSAVDVKHKVITVEAAGAKIQINISEAQIDTEDKEPLKLSELVSFIGENVTAHDVYKKEGILYATRVRLDIDREDRADSGQSTDADTEHGEDEEENR